MKDDQWLNHLGRDHTYLSEEMTPALLRQAHAEGSTPGTIPGTIHMAYETEISQLPDFPGLHLRTTACPDNDTRAAANLEASLLPFDRASMYLSGEDMWGARALEAAYVRDLIDTDAPVLCLSCMKRSAVAWTGYHLAEHLAASLFRWFRQVRTPRLNVITTALAESPRDRVAWVERLSVFGLETVMAVDAHGPHFMYMPYTHDLAEIRKDALMHHILKEVIL